MKSYFLLLLANFAFVAYSQVPNIQWQKCLGSSNASDSTFNVYTGDEEAKSTIETSDNGLLLVGLTSGNNNDVQGNHGTGSTTDIWVVKLNGSGQIQWQKCFGGSSYEQANDVIETPDNGFIIVGSTYSNNGDVIGNHGNSDFWILKIDGFGNIQWKKCFGGLGNDYANSIYPDNQGGYIVVGEISSASASSGDITSFNGGSSDGWVLKISDIGVLVWQKSIGGYERDIARDIVITDAGEIVIAGSTSSFYGLGNHGGNDFWVVKLNSIGSVIWNKMYGGSTTDDANSIILTSDNKLVLVGQSSSINGEVTGNNSVSSLGFDFWVIKIDLDGGLVWQKCLGGTAEENAFSAIEDSNGNILVTGRTRSWDCDLISTNHGASDVWFTILNAQGVLIYEHCFGGIGDEIGYSIIQLSSGEFCIAGYTNSNDYNGDVIGNHGGNPYKDIWLIKLSQFNSVNQLERINVHFSPNPTTDKLTIERESISMETFKIFDDRGICALNGNLEITKSIIDLATLTSGNYFIQIGENTSNTFKIVKL